MNVAHIIDGYFATTGVATHVRELTRHLAQNNVNTIVFSSDVQTINITSYIKSVHILDWPLIPQPLTIFYKLAMVHKYTPISVVHVHDSVAMVGVYIFARIFRVPIVFTFHASIFIIGRKFDYPYHIVKIYRFTNRFAAKHADKVICGSKSMENAVKNAGATNDRIVNLMHPIESRFFALGVTRDERQSDFKECLFVGRLVPTKGAEILIRAIPAVLEKYPRIQFVLVGNGPLKSNLIKLCKEFGIQDQVRFAGDVSNDKLHLCYKRAALFVLPSMDTQGLVLQQAMASGLPVVASNVGSIPEKINDGETGILVEPGNSKALAKAIIDILKDDELRNAMSIKAVAAVKELSWEKNISRFIELYSTLAGVK